MTHEQMVAWLILEGWEYHPKLSHTLCHIARNMRDETGYGIRRGELVVMGQNTAKYLSSGTTSTDVEDYEPTFSSASETEVKLFYNALQENQND